MVGYTIKEGLECSCYHKANWTKGRIYYPEKDGKILSSNKRINADIMYFNKAVLENVIGGKLL